MATKKHFPTSYAAIVKRMKRIQPMQYGNTRNFIDGKVTWLSPYISRGVISTKQVFDLVLKQQDIKTYGVYKLIQELAWRDFFQLVYKSLGNDILKDITYKQPNAKYKSMPYAIQHATTGITVVDELLERFYNTGYLHNHVRMYIASITCNVAKTYWLQPSRWLYYHLLDGDIASNTCSWQWVAGAFSWKQYYCNQDNINRYTHTQQKDTFLDKPYDVLVKMDMPEVFKKRTTLKLTTTLPKTTTPQINTALPTLIYNSYNLDPLWRKKEKANRILLLEPSHFKQFPVSDDVITFVTGLAANIKGIQIFSGEVQALTAMYKKAGVSDPVFISKEHPSCNHYPGTKDERDWMFPEITGFHQSYSVFWKKADKLLKAMK
ncbi:FAD-binding domain-containing protein [Ferruginibacter paludis]|uniref:FAD-binding domain-containing protein n=1 Tax=Ferruginibacter paludis TaxID=1310417 RepID=UPI0025B35097|nr:FAD-binding domain-containing protein [Ferruginibacter paludis]MDN3655392.1 FAD-binding domain-containing protein [Ferruginibacter paludis]